MTKIIRGETIADTYRKNSDRGNDTRRPAPEQVKEVWGVDLHELIDVIDTDTFYAGREMTAANLLDFLSGESIPEPNEQLVGLVRIVAINAFLAGLTLGREEARRGR